MTSGENRQEPVIPESTLAVEEGDRVAPAHQRGGTQTVRIAGRKKKSGTSRVGAPRFGAGMLLMLALSVAMVYLFWNAREQEARNAALMSQLDAARQRIDGLERALSAAGASLSESETQVEGKVGDLAHEVRKLWDVSNKRNKKWIQENQLALENLSQAGADLKATVSGEIAEVRKALEQVSAERKQESEAYAGLQAGLAELPAMRKELDKAAAATSELQKSVAKQHKDAEASRNGMTEDLQGLQQNLLSMQARSDQFGVQVTRLKAALAKLEQDFAAAQSSSTQPELDALRQAMAENEQAVRSFDAFRQQTNQSITSLQAAVSKLQRNN